MPRVLEIETRHGPARAHVHEADRPVGCLVLGHGAGGGVGAPDLLAVAGDATLVNSGNAGFSMSGDALPTSAYPVTENWQKSVGGYQQWSSADVAVDGTTVTMTVTVHAEDYYNFNRGQADIARSAGRSRSRPPAPSPGR